MADERGLVTAFVELVDTLADEFDVTAYAAMLVRHCTELLGVEGVAVELVDPDGALRPLAASSEQVRVVETVQWLNREGPCAEAFRSGVVVGHDDLGAATDRWPRFAARAVGEGFASVRAVPIRLRAEVVGVLTLFRVDRGPWNAPALATARSLASMAAIGLIQERGVREARERAAQLQAALTSRLAIELAKGILVGRLGVEPAAAFEILRGHARSNNLKIGGVAATVIANNSDAGPLPVGPPTTGGPDGTADRRSRRPRPRPLSPSPAPP